jgi:uncharacterized protein (TIGR03437 family)
VVAHTDHHALAFSSDGSRLYDGNDGGVFSTANLSSSTPIWANLNATLAITEFSSNISIHPSNPQIAYAGTQDNGTQLYSGNLIWDQVVYGDGGWTAIDPAVPGIWYGAFQGSSIYRLSAIDSLSSFVTPYLTTFPILANGINVDDRTLSYPPFTMDPSKPLRLYFGTHRLYQSIDGAGTWTAISPDLTAGFGAITAVAVSPARSGNVAVGTTDGKVQVTNYASQGSAATWTDSSIGLPGRPIAKITFDPVAPATFYVSLSGFSHFLPNDNLGHVLKTTDLGENYTDISGNLPNIPVNDLVVDPDSPGVLYIATDIGVFQSSDDGQTWFTMSKGLPRVLVRSLNLHRSSRTLRAATYGRSVWDLSVPLSTDTRAPRIDSPSTLTAAADALSFSVTGSNFDLTSRVRWNGSDRPTQIIDAFTLEVSLLPGDLVNSGRATLLVFNSEARGGLSNSLNVSVGSAPAVSAANLASAADPFAMAALVPGSIATLHGTNLAADTVTAATPPLPYTLGQATVEVNGIPAPLYYVSPGQINFQVPWELEGFDRATVRVINGTLVSSTVQVKVITASPALFSADGSGSGQGSILISGPEVMAAPAGAFPGSRPARIGESIEILATGLGPVSRTQGDGQPKPTTTPPALSRIPNVRIGGVPALVTFSGLLPGGVGMYQVIVQVPDGAAAGDAVPVSISLGGVVSNSVTMAVSR